MSEKQIKWIKRTYLIGIIVTFFSALMWTSPTNKIDFSEYWFAVKNNKFLFIAQAVFVVGLIMTIKHWRYLMKNRYKDDKDLKQSKSKTAGILILWIHLALIGFVWTIIGSIHNLDSGTIYMNKFAGFWGAIMWIGSFSTFVIPCLIAGRNAQTSHKRLIGIVSALFILMATPIFITWIDLKFSFLLSISFKDWLLIRWIWFISMSILFPSTYLLTQILINDQIEWRRPEKVVKSEEW